MSHSFILPEPDTHDLLSVTHGDTVAAAVLLGALVVGAADAAAVVATTRDKHAYADGANFHGIDTTLDTGVQKYWADGEAATDITSASSGSGSTTPTWRRLVHGAVGTYLRVGGSGALEWANVGAAVGVGTSARVYRATDQSFSFGADAAISFSTADWDDGGYWSALSPTKLIAPSAGTYMIVGQLSFPNDFFGIAMTRIFVNGVVRGETAGGGLNLAAGFGVYDSHQASVILKLAANDYVELHSIVARYSGASEATKGGQNYTWLSIARMG